MYLIVSDLRWEQKSVATTPEAFCEHNEEPCKASKEKHGSLRCVAERDPSKVWGKKISLSFFNLMLYRFYLASRIL